MTTNLEITSSNHHTIPTAIPISTISLSICRTQQLVAPRGTTPPYALALNVGRSMHFRLLKDDEITIVAIETRAIYDFSEELSAQVAATVP